MNNATTSKDMGKVNVVRIAMGAEFVRFEVSEFSEWGTRHDSCGRKATVHLDDMRIEVGEKMASGWKVAA